MASVSGGLYAFTLCVSGYGAIMGRPSEEATLRVFIRITAGRDKAYDREARDETGAGRVRRWFSHPQRTKRTIRHRIFHNEYGS